MHALRKYTYTKWDCHICIICNNKVSDRKIYLKISVCLISVGDKNEYLLR